MNADPSIFIQTTVQIVSTGILIATLIISALTVRYVITNVEVKA